MSAVTCEACGARFEGTRAEARRVQWEPTSTRSQAAIDSGPMTCASCIDGLLTELLDAMRGYARS